MGLMMGRFQWLGVLVALIGCVSVVSGQAVRFDNKREVAIPDYATLRIGPFYSTASYHLQVGYRWSASDGAGTDYIRGNQRGVILEDGSDFPIINTLTFRNYLLITRNMDLDISFRVGYEYYPMGTSEDQWFFDMADEGVFGTISFQYRLTPMGWGEVYDRFEYRVDYVDSRGQLDRFGGRRYEHIDNTLGTSLTWDFAKDQRIRGRLSRQDVVPFDDEFEEQERVTHRARLDYETDLTGRITLGAGVEYIDTDYSVPYRLDVQYLTYRIYARLNEGLSDDPRLTVKLSDYTSAWASLGYSLGYGATVGRSETITQTGEGNPTISENRVDGSDYSTATGALGIRTHLRENVWHSLEYRRELIAGWQAALDVIDLLEYRLQWDGEATTASLTSTYRATAPTSEVVRDYTDWLTRLIVDYPLTRMATLNLGAGYQQRRNTGELVAEGLLEPDEIYDYDTWWGRVGTTVDLTKKVTFVTYYAYVARDGDSEDLDYSRHIFEAFIRYRHDF